MNFAVYSKDDCPYCHKVKSTTQPLDTRTKTPYNTGVFNETR